MCVILHLPARTTVSKKQLEKCYDTNKDGWGIMYSHKGELVTIKNTTNFKDFYNHWRDTPFDTERALHFRIRTSGLVHKHNCHPFNPSEKVGVMHNGMINTAMIHDDGSDTYNFCRYELPPILEGFGEDFIKDEKFASLIEAVTGYSKLLFMTADGKVLKTRKNLWQYREGVHYSNSLSILYDYGNKSSYQSYGTDGSYSSDTGYISRTRQANSYAAIKDTSETVVSDLYSGNKTDSQGQNYIDNKKEVHRKQQLDEDKLITKAAQAILNKELNSCSPGVRSALEDAYNNEEPESVEDEEYDILEHDAGVIIEAEDIQKMTFIQLLEFVQEFPRSAVVTVQDLVERALMAETSSQSMSLKA